MRVLLIIAIIVAIIDLVLCMNSSRLSREEEKRKGGKDA